jgi:hypothetical protein
LIPLIRRTIDEHGINIELVEELFSETRQVQILFRRPVPVLEADNKRFETRIPGAIPEYLQAWREV